MSNNNELHIIIQGCIHQNRRSQAEFYQKFYGFAAAICHTYIKSMDEAIEAVNEGFLKIFTDIGKFVSEDEFMERKMKGWIKRIMINTSIDYYRKFSKNMPELQTVDEEVTDYEVNEISAIDKLSYNDVVSLVHQLSPMYRIVFNLFVIEGMTHEEISKELNISAGTSKSNLAKARMNLVRIMEQNKKEIV